MKKKFHISSAALFMAISVIVMCLMTGCGKQKKAELNLITSPIYPPFEYHAGNTLTGIDIDIMREIAARINYDLKIHTANFEEVIQTVKCGQADVGCGAISITEVRKKQVDFSIPYAFIGQKVLVPEKSSIRRIEDLRGKMIGAQADTTSAAYVKEKFGEVVAYPNIEVATDALESGRLDALVMDSLPAAAIAAKKQDIRMLPEKLTEESCGLIVNKKNPELLKKINECLADMLKTGWIERSIKRHIDHSGLLQQKITQKIPRLKIGIVPTYPPYETKRNGVFEGIDIDIIHRICSEIKHVPLFVEINSDTVYQSISDDDVTVSISSLTITDERKKTVDFSIPYSEVAQMILVKRKSVLKRKEDLKGKRIGVVIGTTSEEQGLHISDDVERYSEPEIMLKALERGEVDAIVMDDVILKQMTMNSDAFRFLPDVLMKEEYGIAVSKKEPVLLKKINSVLHEMKKDGSLARIHAKHISKKTHSSE